MCPLSCDLYTHAHTHTRILHTHMHTDTLRLSSNKDNSSAHAGGTQGKCQTESCFGMSMKGWQLRIQSGNLDESLLQKSWKPERGKEESLFVARPACLRTFLLVVLWDKRRREPYEVERGEDTITSNPLPI